MLIVLYLGDVMGCFSFVLVVYGLYYGSVFGVVLFVWLCFGFVLMYWWCYGGIVRIVGGIMVLLVAFWF